MVDLLEPRQHTLRFMARGSVLDLFRGEWKNHREMLLDGVVGCAKTIGILRFIVETCVQSPGLKWCILRKTRVSLVESVFPSLRQVLFDPRLYLLHDYGGDPPDDVMDEVRTYLRTKWDYLLEGRTDETRLRMIFQKPEGWEGEPSSVTFGGMDAPRKWRGTEYDAVYVNECNEFTNKEWESLRRAMRNKTWGHHPVIGDCNPDAPNHWLMKRVATGRTKRMQCFFGDNPWITDTAEGRQYVKDVRAQYTGVELRRNGYGEWAGAEGMVWPEFDVATHLIRGRLAKKAGQWILTVTNGLGATPEEPVEVEFTWFFAGQDWGHKVPGCLGIWGVTREGRMILVEEFYLSKKNRAKWWAPKVAAANKKYGLVKVVCDNAEPDSIELYNNFLGWPEFEDDEPLAVGCQKGKKANSDLVRDRLMTGDDGHPMLLFLEDARAHEADPRLVEGVPSCTHEEIPAYIYKEVDEDKEDREEPVKANDHGCDMTMYSVRWAHGRNFTPPLGEKRWKPGSWGDLLDLDEDFLE